jgi:hypothetical protein
MEIIAEAAVIAASIIKSVKSLHELWGDLKKSQNPQATTTMAAPTKRTKIRRSAWIIFLALSDMGCTVLALALIFTVGKLPGPLTNFGAAALALAGWLMLMGAMVRKLADSSW